MKGKRKLKYISLLSAFSAYLTAYFMAGNSIRGGLSVAIAAFTVAMATLYIVNLKRYLVIKEELRGKLSDSEKEFLNYVFFRPVPDWGISLPVVSPHWKKERKFQDKRNDAIRKVDKEKSASLVNLEKTLFYDSYVIFIFALFSYFSFLNLNY